MTVKSDLKFRQILETINSNFDFLLAHDFRIVSAMFTGCGTESWQVMMASEECFIQLYCDRGKIGVGLSTLSLYEQVGAFDLGTLINLINGEDQLDITEMEHGNETQQIREMARLLGKYFDNILMDFEILIIPLLNQLCSSSGLDKKKRWFMDHRFFLSLLSTNTQVLQD